MTFEDDFPTTRAETYDETVDASRRVACRAVRCRSGTAETAGRAAAAARTSSTRARPMPLSASAMINKEEVLELLDEALDRLPESCAQARWLLKEREEYLAKMRHEGDEILEQARARAERMVQRTEVVKAAEHRARQISTAPRPRPAACATSVEDFCDQKLASFEIVLERTLKLVAAGPPQAAGRKPARPRAEPEPDLTTERLLRPGPVA